MLKTRRVTPRTVKASWTNEPNGCVRSVMNNRKLIAQVPIHGSTNTQLANALSNARLITAAPDMYNELAHLAKMCRGVLSSADIKRIEQVLDKADGITLQEDVRRSNLCKEIFVPTGVNGNEAMKCTIRYPFTPNDIVCLATGKDFKQFTMQDRLIIVGITDTAYIVSRTRKEADSLQVHKEEFEVPTEEFHDNFTIWIHMYERNTILKLIQGLESPHPELTNADRIVIRDYGRASHASNDKFLVTIHNSHSQEFITLSRSQIAHYTYYASSSDFPYTTDNVIQLIQNNDLIAFTTDDQLVIKNVHGPIFHVHRVDTPDDIRTLPIAVGCMFKLVAISCVASA